MKISKRLNAINFIKIIMGNQNTTGDKYTGQNGDQKLKNEI